MKRLRRCLLMRPLSRCVVEHKQSSWTFLAFTTNISLIVMLRFVRRIACISFVVNSLKCNRFMGNMCWFLNDTSSPFPGITEILWFTHLASEHLHTWTVGFCHLPQTFKNQMDLVPKKVWKSVFMNVNSFRGRVLSPQMKLLACGKKSSYNAILRVLIMMPFYTLAVCLLYNKALLSTANQTPTSITRTLPKSTSHLLNK